MLRISHGALRITKGLKMCGLYILNGSTVIGHAFITSQDSYVKTKLWHWRVRYLSERGLIEIAKQCLLGKNRLEKLEFIDNCIWGKEYRVKFSSNKHHLSRFLSMFTCISRVLLRWPLMGRLLLLFFSYHDWWLFYTSMCSYYKT